MTSPPRRSDPWPEIRVPEAIQARWDAIRDLLSTGHRRNLERALDRLRALGAPEPYRFLLDGARYKKGRLSLRKSPLRYAFTRDQADAIGARLLADAPPGGVPERLRRGMLRAALRRKP